VTDEEIDGKGTERNYENVGTWKVRRKAIRT
jgi:hypothetical protein